MSHAAPAWPVKTREFHNHHFDSTVWNGFAFRDDDVVVSTYAKSGTTWTQQIVGQLVFNGDPTVSVGEMSPWVDLRVPPREVKIAALEAQAHRRILKTHLPVDALVYSPKAKYIYIARDGRDVVWSMYNHHKNGNEAYYDVLNNTPGRVGPPILPPKDDLRAYFHDWLDGNGEPWWPFWENVRTWWAIRGLPNLHLVHFNDLKRDLPGEMRRIAKFLDIAIDESRWPAIVEHCTFDWMKRHASRSAPMGGALWEGGGETFINKGSNGRWTDTLTVEDCARYERRAVEELGAECARWLKFGSAPVIRPAANDPRVLAA
ncbi:MAG TPA: sulfotransferase domain-containing protein [Nevskiaceae bacterium]|nr:sulfotransferase domain-containing protein [Nevskiaceae bacterium]